MYVRALWCSVDKINRLFCLHKYYKAKYCRLEENCSLLGGHTKYEMLSIEETEYLLSTCIKNFLEALLSRLQYELFGSLF